MRCLPTRLAPLELTRPRFAGHTAPIEREIRQLSAALEAVKDEQEYIVVRERLHRDSEFAFSFPSRPLAHSPHSSQRPNLRTTASSTGLSFRPSCSSPFAAGRSSTSSASSRSSGLSEACPRQMVSAHLSAVLDDLLTLSRLPRSVRLTIARRTL